MMFYSKKIHARINKLHERALRVVYKNDDNLTFEELLIKDNSFSVHDRNLQKLAELMYKVKNDLLSEREYLWNRRLKGDINIQKTLKSC